jgi:hypothetical protein
MHRLWKLTPDLDGPQDEDLDAGEGSENSGGYDHGDNDQDKDDEVSNYSYMPDRWELDLFLAIGRCTVCGS